MAAVLTMLDVAETASSEKTRARTRRNAPTIKIGRSLAGNGAQIFAVSGRESACSEGEDMEPSLLEKLRSLPDILPRRRGPGFYLVVKTSTVATGSSAFAGNATSKPPPALVTLSCLWSLSASK